MQAWMTRFSVLHLLERHDEVMNDVSAAADWLLQLLSRIAANTLGAAFLQLGCLRFFRVIRRACDFFGDSEGKSPRFTDRASFELDRERTTLKGLFSAASTNERVHSMF